MQRRDEIQNSQLLISAEVTVGGGGGGGGSGGEGREAEIIFYFKLL